MDFLCGSIFIAWRVILSEVVSVAIIFSSMMSYRSLTDSYDVVNVDFLLCQFPMLIIVEMSGPVFFLIVDGSRFFKIWHNRGGTTEELSSIDKISSNEKPFFQFVLT